MRVRHHEVQGKVWIVQNSINTVPSLLCLTALRKEVPAILPFFNS